jgi:DNA-binding HxlR family transcriptional regulator
MIMIRGFLEILQMTDGNGQRSFNDFTKISIRKRRLSSATVSKRLDELTGIKAIEEVVSKSKTGRRIISYKTTDKGRRILELADELNKAIGTPK